MRILFLLLMLGTSALASPAVEAAGVPRAIGSYGEQGGSTLWTILAGRVAAEPFNLVATLIFLIAICHTFLASRFLALSRGFHRRFLDMKHETGPRAARMRDRLQFRFTVFHFLGEVEAVFGIWAIPLAVAMVAFYGWLPTVHYFNGVSYTEPIFVFVVMAIASSKPILRLAENCLSLFAALGGKTPAAWWLAILTAGPLLGSFITEPAAMTICALLLLERFYKLKPSMTLRYATLGLLFVNISVGGTLSHFAAPPVVMVAGKWGWGLSYMFENFGWKAVCGIVVSNILFFAWFRRELLGLKSPDDASKSHEPVPPFVTIVHTLAIAWTVSIAHYPALVVFGLLFFMAFVLATNRHQDAIALRGPLLVGFFLAALVIHGGCQQWWIAPVLGGLTKWPLMIGATLLTAVNDNAAITYLASLVPGFTEELKFAVVSGAVAGGGLTVIANAPNPAGQSILSAQFGEGGVQPLGLFLAALSPTLIMGAALMLLP